MNNQRKLQNYLINRKLQISIAVKFVLFALLSSLSSAFAVYYTLWPTLSRLIPKDIFPILQKNFVFILFWDSALIVFFIFLVGIVITHRIAGPLYNIERKLDKALQGKEIELIKLRDGDELQEVADKINELLLKVKNTSTK